jgi:MFS family permease
MCNQKLQFVAMNCYLWLHIEKGKIMKNALHPAGTAGIAAGRVAAGGPPPAAGRPWRAFTLLVVTYFITIVDFTIVNVALPTIGRDLRFPEPDLQWLVTAYGLTFAGFLLLGGRAAEELGRRRVLMAGLAVFTASSLAGGLARSDTFLIVMRGRFRSAGGAAAQWSHQSLAPGPSVVVGQNTPQRG